MWHHGELTNLHGWNPYGPTQYRGLAKAHLGLAKACLGLRGRIRIWLQRKHTWGYPNIISGSSEDHFRLFGEHFRAIGGSFLNLRGSFLESSECWLLSTEFEKQAEYWVLSTKYCMLRAEGWVLNTEPETKRRGHIECCMQSVEYWVLRYQYCALNIEYCVINTRLDAEYWVLNTGAQYWLLRQRDRERRIDPISRVLRMYIYIYT